MFRKDDGALFSKDRVYRYVLWRTWNPLRPFCMFIGLNPSTADETTNDPTVRRCIGYARDWDYGGLIMTNIFALRATDPRVMKSHPNPVGPKNDMYLRTLSSEAFVVIAAWGIHGYHLCRGEEVINLLGNKLYCLGTTEKGHPKHPLYLRKNLKPIPFAT